MSTTFVQDGTAMQHGIDETHRRFEDAFNRGDAAGAARQLYTRYARILPPGAWWMAGTGSPSTGPQPRPRRSWASGSGAIHARPAAAGRWRIRDRTPTLTLARGQRVSPRCVVVWKQEDGIWRRRLDIWNMDKV